MRDARGWRQADVAAIMGVSVRNVCNWECGRYCPTLLAALSLADAFGVTIDELFGDVVQRTKGSGE